jgi:hypothetical protein
MNRLAVVLVFGICSLMLISGCSSPSEERAATAARTETEPLDEETAAAARTRGLPGDSEQAADEAKPQVVLSSLTYEWRTAPERGIEATLVFTNPAHTYERARGYVFLVAESVLSGSLITGVYPWNTTIGDEGLPEDYTDGAHLLYRDTQEVRGFIPYSTRTASF